VISWLCARPSSRKSAMLCSVGHGEALLLIRCLVSWRDNSTPDGEFLPLAGCLAAELDSEHVWKQQLIRGIVTEQRVLQVAAEAGQLENESQESYITSGEDRPSLCLPWYSLVYMDVTWSMNLLNRYVRTWARSPQVVMVCSAAPLPAPKAPRCRTYRYDWYREGAWRASVVPLQALIRMQLKPNFTVKNAVLWDVTSCGCCRNLRFGGTYRLH
jgi:hypothetical protein